MSYTKASRVRALASRRANGQAFRVSIGLEPTPWAQALKIARADLAGGASEPRDQKASATARNHGIVAHYTSGMTRQRQRVSYSMYVSAFTQLKAGVTEPVEPVPEFKRERPCEPVRRHLALTAPDLLAKVGAGEMTVQEACLASLKRQREHLVTPAPTPAPTTLDNSDLI